jgi:hypothetical protein
MSSYIKVLFCHYCLKITLSGPLSGFPAKYKKEKGFIRVFGLNSLS